MHTLIHTPKLLNIDGRRSFCYIWQVFEVDEADRKCIEVQKLFLPLYSVQSTFECVLVGKRVCGGGIGGIDVYGDELQW